MLSRRNPSSLALLAAALLLPPLTACNSKSSATPANFTAGLNAHFADHPDCLFANPPHFPYETSDPAMTKQLNALAAEQLLKVEEERDLHVSRYTTTDAGARVRVARSRREYRPGACRSHAPAREKRRAGGRGRCFRGPGRTRLIQDSWSGRW